MVFGLSMMAVIYVLYVLLIKGALWKLILGAFGWFGMYWFLRDITEFKGQVFAGSESFTWAMMVPTIIVMLAMMCTKEE